MRSFDPKPKTRNWTLIPPDQSRFTVWVGSDKNCHLTQFGWCQGLTPAPSLHPNRRTWHFVWLPPKTVFHPHCANASHTPSFPKTWTMPKYSSVAGVAQKQWNHPSLTLCCIHKPVGHWNAFICGRILSRKKTFERHCGDYVSDYFCQRTLLLLRICELGCPKESAAAVGGYEQMRFHSFWNFGLFWPPRFWPSKMRRTMQKEEQDKLVENEERNTLCWLWGCPRLPVQPLSRAGFRFRVVWGSGLFKEKSRVRGRPRSLRVGQGRWGVV